MMANRQPFWNRSMKEFIGDAMSQLVFSGAVEDRAIAIGFQGSSPQPAIRLRMISWHVVGECLSRTEITRSRWASWFTISHVEPPSQVWPTPGLCRAGAGTQVYQAVAT